MNPEFIGCGLLLFKTKFLTHYIGVQIARLPKRASILEHGWLQTILLTLYQTTISIGTILLHISCSPSSEINEMCKTGSETSHLEEGH